MIVNVDQKPVDVLYLVGNPNGDTFQIEGNICCPYDMRVWAIQNNLETVDLTSKRWMS